ncbi:YfgM family protein [Candidatus Methylocalor cossyra]
MTEEERLEALQRWWKDHRRALLGGVLLGLAVVAGWNMWQSNRQATAEQASALYQQLLKATAEQQTESAQKLGERIVEKYPSTLYAHYARLFLARAKVTAGDLQGARQVLEEELAKSDDDGLKHIVRLRLASVLLGQGEIDPALRLVEPFAAPASGKFAPLYEELKGDLLAAAKRPAEALKAYQKAKELGNASPLLELKLSDLPAAAGP